MTQALPESLATLRVLLNASDNAQRMQGMEMIRALDDRALWAIYADGVTLDGDGKPSWGEDTELEQHVHGTLQPQLAAWALKKTGQLDGITSFQISGAVWMTNLDILSGLSSLTRLHVGAVKTMDLDGLRHVPGLTWLKVSLVDSLPDLSGLAHVPALTELNINRSHRIKDWDGLRALENLSTLQLIHLRDLRQVDMLGDLKMLRDVKLFACAALQSINGLAGLPHLHRLELRRCDGLENLDALADLPSLTALSLSNCGPQSIAPLRDVPTLRDVDLFGSTLTHIDTLQDLTDLNRLSIYRFLSLKDTALFKEMKDLRALQLDTCVALEDLSGLTALPALTTLNLSSSKALSDLWPLIHLSGLQDLNLSHCTSVTDLRPLKRLRALSRLNLQRCPAVGPGQRKLYTSAEEIRAMLDDCTPPG